MTNQSPQTTTTPMNTNGKITGIRGQIVEVVFTESPPFLHQVLTIADIQQKIYLEVISSRPSQGMYQTLEGYYFYCLSLTDSKYLHRGMNVVNTGKYLQIPVGDQLLGRVIDLFGNPHDGKPVLNMEPNFETEQILITNELSLNKIRPSQQVIETGIKVIDFFTPIIRGGKAGLFGGAGVGKTILLTELINNLLVHNPSNKDIKAVFSAVGERSREAQELYSELAKTEAFKNMTVILGQMGENPAVRSRTAYAAATIASSFRDQNNDVLFLMDNMYRFAQAGHELSIMMKTLPSEEGYQATLTSEMSQLHSRLSSTDTGYITAVEAIFVPSDDMTDYGVRSIFPYLDTFIVLSRNVYQQGRMPAIDILSSNSRALNREIIGKVHYQAYIEAKKMLENSANLEKIVSLVGFSELTLEDQTLYKRSILLKNYMTQSFYTTQTQTGRPGSYVQLSQTVNDVRNILNGKYDLFHPEKLKYVGSIEELL